MYIYKIITNKEEHLIQTFCSYVLNFVIHQIVHQIIKASGNQVQVIYQAKFLKQKN